VNPLIARGEMSEMNPVAIVPRAQMIFRMCNISMMVPPP
jgi:hypothetical protein